MAEEAKMIFRTVLNNCQCISNPLLAKVWALRGCINNKLKVNSNNVSLIIVIWLLCAMDRHAQEKLTLY
jgi:hypothetical protein